MRINRFKRFSLSNIAILLCLLLLASCGSESSSENRKQMKTKADLQGAVIGVQLGTTSDGLATELEKKGDGTKVERYNKGADAIQALLQGKIDCMVTDEAPAKAFQRVNPSLQILPETFDASSFAICVGKDHAELKQSINHAIRILKANGVIDSIVNRHLERGIAVAYTPKASADKLNSSSDAPHPSDVKKMGPEALQKLGLKKSLRFATNATFEPFEYYQNGKIVGIDVDVANAIGDVLGVDVEILDMEFDAIITSVQAGKADAGIAGITVTPEREKNIGFTDSYADVRQVIMVNSGDAKVADAQHGFVDKFKSCFIDDNRYQYMLQGLGNTLIITFFAIILSVILGTLIAIVRARHERKGDWKVPNIICQLYLTIMRGTPTMVQLLIIYYVVFASADVNKIFVAVIAFGLNSAAYIAEVIRSGIMSVDNGQMEAGRSLGLSYGKTMRLIILPQAFKNVLPAMGNELITLLKETSISGYIGLVDLTKGSDIIRSITYEAMMPLGVVALVYLFLVLGLNAGVRKLEKRLRKSERK